MNGIPDYFTHDDMFGFNKVVDDQVTDYEQVEIEDVPDYAGFVVEPDDIDPELLEELAFLIDRDPRYRTKDGRKFGPSTKSRLLSSLNVAYILNENDVPIGVATVIDPTEEGWDGQRAKDRYEMLIGKSLKGRNEMRLLTVDENYDPVEIAKLLTEKITEVQPNLYTVSNLDENKVTKIYVALKYLLVGKFISDRTDRPTGVWVN